jgi:hypothetical protein
MSSASFPPWAGFGTVPFIGRLPRWSTGPGPLAPLWMQFVSGQYEAFSYLPHSSERDLSGARLMRRRRRTNGRYRDIITALP